MRPEKQFLLDEIEDKLGHSKAFIITRYGKMNPNLASKFRSSLLQSGGEFEVVKKRILAKATNKAGAQLDSKALEGHIGIVFAFKDPFQTTKALFKFRQENEEMIDVIFGQFDGRVYSAKDVEQLSKIPSEKELKAQFLGLLEAAPAQLLAVFEAKIESAAATQSEQV